METAELLLDGAEALARAGRARHAAETLSESSRWLVRYARALRNREVRWLRGGADPPVDGAEAATRARLRRLIDEGALPRAEPQKVWARVSPGGGETCTGCGLAFEKGQPEYEFTTADVVIVTFHRHCLTLYARVVLDGAGDGDGHVQARP